MWLVLGHPCVSALGRVACLNLVVRLLVRRIWMNLIRVNRVGPKVGGSRAT